MWDLIFNRNKKNLPNYFSYSLLNCYELCSEQYKLVYIDGIKKKYESIESYMGKRVHSVLEWLYKPENKEEYINFDRICEEYDKEWINNRVEAQDKFWVDLNNGGNEDYSIWRLM